MRKILIILVTLLLSGCFHDPKEIALENCANSSFMYKHTYSYKLITGNALLAEKIKQKLEKEISNSNIKASLSNIENSTSILLEFAEKNFNLDNLEIRSILNTSYKSPEGFSDEAMAMMGEKHDPDLVINKITTGTEQQKNQFKEIVKDYNRNKAMLKLNINFRSKLTTKLFLNMKMKDKFLEEKYQKLYQRCERIFNELPSSFINKWKHNTELKEFL